MATVLGDYLNRNIHNILIVNDGVDNRSNMQSVPELEPKGALYVRFEPDTKRMFVDYKHFREECAKSQINFKEVLSDLKKSGAYRGAVTKRLSKGMRINTLPVYAIEIDTSIGDFLAMENFIPEGGDAD
jgi:hypothetical protein